MDEGRRLGQLAICCPAEVFRDAVAVEPGDEGKHRGPIPAPCSDAGEIDASRVIRFGRVQTRGGAVCGSESSREARNTLVRARRKRK